MGFLCTIKAVSPDMLHLIPLVDVAFPETALVLGIRAAVYLSSRRPRATREIPAIDKFRPEVVPHGHGPSGMDRAGAHRQ